MSVLFALLAAFTIHGHGHHHGWQNPHNPHHAPPCYVQFHIGCASINPPPAPNPPGFHLPPPVLRP